MWKIAVGFAVFAGLALYVISKGGDNIDMTGEKHGAEVMHQHQHLLRLRQQKPPLLHPHPQASNFPSRDGPTIGVRSTLIPNHLRAKA